MNNENTKSQMITAGRREPSAGLIVIAAGLIVSLIAGAGAAAAQEGKVITLRTQELSGMPGKEATMLTVEYPPGGSSAPHRHNANVFVYVLEGSVVMQVKGGKEVTLMPGQTFYESPADVHTVSRNASSTKPAKFVVFFVKDKGASLSVLAAEGENQ